MCNGCHAANYGLLQNWGDHMDASDKNVLVIPLIETKRAVERIEEIVDVPGIDFVFFGPGDLSNDMGINLLAESEKLQPAWRKVRDAVHARGKYLISVGFLGFADDADIFTGEMDLLMLHVAMASKMQAHRAIEKKRFGTEAA
jgi:4-hydroxy-2-oxoheptanedioate aldolase